jgi:uncharacterized protein YqjF (DUF2071 family)
MGVKFDFDLFSEIDAIQFAHQNGAKVINASYSGADYSALEKQSIESFSGIFVAASGNASENNDAYPQYPCSYNSANIICVASSDQKDNLSDFSNYGPTTVDIMAPGENILSVFQGELEDSSSRDDYAFVSGTSLAAPMVSGITALLYAHQPTASISTIRETLLKSSDHFSDYSNNIYCGRRLNAKKSLQSIINNEIPVEACKYPTYRFWNFYGGNHFYTANTDERDYIVKNHSYLWGFEGTAFLVYKNEIVNTKAVFRFWNIYGGNHFYTANTDERDYIVKNHSDIWKLEGIAFFVYTDKTTENKPVYRFWQIKTGDHFYTANTDEKDYIIKNHSDIWKLEGIAFFIPAE